MVSLRGLWLNVEWLQCLHDMCANQWTAAKATLVHHMDVEWRGIELLFRQQLQYITHECSTCLKFVKHSYTITGAATVHGVLTTSKESTGSGKFGLCLVFLMFLDLAEMPPHSNSTSGEVTCSRWKRFMSRTPQHSTCRGGGGGVSGG